METLQDINQSIEYIYDKYSPVLYGIALQITSCEKEAEQILIASFQKIQKGRLFNLHNPCTCVKLMKLTIETTCEQFPKYKRSDLAFKQLHQSPIVNRLLSENSPMKSLSRENHLTRSQAMKNFRADLSVLLRIKKDYVVRTIITPG